MRKVVGFILFVSVLISFLPAYNLHKHLVRESFPASAKWWHAENLYSTDDVWGQVSLVLYRLGISSDPSRAVVGKNGWLFLGDQYSQTVSVRRDGPLQGSEDRASRLVASLQKWNFWLERHGVDAFQVIVGPNKSSVYMDQLPDWMVSESPTLADTIMAVDGAQAILFDPTDLLLEKRAALRDNIYYQFDTHWTQVGAQFAAEEFLLRLKSQFQQIVLPPVTPSSKITKIQGGDLSRFLYIDERVEMDSWKPSIAGHQFFSTQQRNLATDEVIWEGGNPEVGTPTEPLMVISKDAVNKLKVLWLRDSFGTAMTPYLSATFTHTVHIHWTDAFKDNATLLIQLVKDWKPDIVLVTIVERDILNDLLATEPPN